MHTKSKYTVVILPDNSRVEVFYFCTDDKLKENEKKNYTNLIVQLHDCHCTYKIDKKIVPDSNLLEGVVQKTVINAKGHLC